MRWAEKGVFVALEESVLKLYEYVVCSDNLFHGSRDSSRMEPVPPKAPVLIPLSRPIELPERTHS